MRIAMQRAGIQGGAACRAERRKLNKELRKLGAPELQVRRTPTSERYRHAPEQGDDAVIEVSARMRMTHSLSQHVVERAVTTHIRGHSALLRLIDDIP